MSVKLRATSGSYNVRACELSRDRPVVKTTRCVVHFLDDTSASFEIDKRSKAQTLLDKVFDHLELVEKDYFGLQFVDVAPAPDGLQTSYNDASSVTTTEVMRWLDPLKPFKKQMGATRPPFYLYFRVKFYVTDPSKLHEEYTRYHFFLQLKKDIVEGRLVLPYKTAILLASYAVQSELGDHHPDEHTPGYLSELRFIPNQTNDFEDEVADLHRQHRGMTPAVCEQCFLETSKDLGQYGVDIHNAVWDQSDQEIQLGVTAAGLVVFQNNVRINTFSWSKIVKISFKRKQFFIQLRKESTNDSSTPTTNTSSTTEGLENLIGFNMVSYRSCKNLWKSCVEHHTFFRLHAAPPVKSGFLSIGSKFRYSGRTEFQTLEENKKRAKIERTFSRSPSKRYARRTIGAVTSYDRSPAGATTSHSLDTFPDTAHSTPNRGLLPNSTSYPSSLRSAQHSNNNDGFHSNHVTRKTLPSDYKPEYSSLNRREPERPPRSEYRSLRPYGDSTRQTPPRQAPTAALTVNSRPAAGYKQNGGTPATTGPDTIGHYSSNSGSLRSNASTIRGFSDKASVRSNASSHVTTTSSHVTSPQKEAAPPVPSKMIGYNDDDKSLTDQSYELPTYSEHMPNGTTYQDNHGLVTIRIRPDSLGRFGFNVKGGADQSMPIIVSRVAPNTPADLCMPRLNEGDQVLYINGRDVSQHTHEQVVMFIKASRETHSGELMLIVRPNAVYIGEDTPDEPDFQYIPDTHAVTSTLPPGGDPLAGSLVLLQEALDSGAATAQFEQVYRKKPGMTLNAAKLADNVPKNRYRDISPYDQTRVKIRHPAGDYINANFVNMEIPGSGVVNRYIACQGPLPSTSADFWQMVWEQHSTLIVMLTTNVERGRVKCHQYWPSLYHTADLSPLTVTCVKEETSHAFAFRDFTLAHEQAGKGTAERHIRQMQYIAWPDHGVPDDNADFLDFVLRVRQNRVGMTEPTVVHCSAGIGRTGVLITMETAMCLIEANQPISPLDIVRHMRDQRAMLIQTSSQYKFVCEAILRVFNDKIVQPLDDYKR